jgi:hypothetical protein
MNRYPKPKWAESQTVRMSGLVEDVCRHGVGHPNARWLEAHPLLKHLSIHGCDGCCWGKEGAAVPKKKKLKKIKK